MYQKYRLRNGTRVVMEHISHVQSVSIGVWIKAGSINENAKNNGITHFIEHMLFKGTKSMTAKEIAVAIDDVGGQLNAFTGNETTCYYAKVLNTHIDVAINVLTDMLFNSIFNPEDIEKEKSVVLEEISMYDDSPEDIAHDLLFKTIFKQHPMGSPILGDRETVSKFDRNSIIEYMRKYYVPENIVVSVVGNFDTKSVIELLEEKFKQYTNEKACEDKRIIPKFHSDISIKNKEIEQLHLCIGFKGFSITSKNYYPLLLMNTVFGGSMSSRLFQKIREDRGLAYSVFSYPSFYKEAGLFTICAGINPSQLENVCKLIREEIKIMKDNGLNKNELLKCKEQLKGNYILGLESTSSRMLGIGKSELLLNRIDTPKEILQKIDDVTIEEIYNVVQKMFTIEEVAIAAVGNIDEKIDIRSYLE